MCCDKLAKTVKNGQRIATGWAYMAAGVNQVLSERRVKICNNCAQLRGGLICAQCGCPVDAKTRLPQESCPLKKWIEEPAS